jgi:hypothetical protein
MLWGRLGAESGVAGGRRTVEKIWQGRNVQDLRRLHAARRNLFRGY